MSVIFHIDESDKWDLLLHNVSNLIKVIDQPTQIEVLANSGAVTYYLTHHDLLDELIGQGVNFVACQNALNAHHIKKEDLVPYISVVPVGVYELMSKQMEGFAYIKP